MVERAWPEPDEEAGRLAALRELGILDTPTDPRFDRLARLACDLFSAPTALISLIDADRQWFKSRIGFKHRETGRETAFCSHTICRPEVLVVPDARHDRRFADNPLVTGPLGIRFYAGAPLVIDGGHAVGTLCVLDTESRPAFVVGDQARLAALAGAVVDLMLSHKADRAAQRTQRVLRTALEAMTEGFSIYDEDDRLLFCNDRYREVYATSADLIVEGARFEDIIREGARRGQYAGLTPGTVEDFVSARMARHRAPSDPFEQSLGDGRWLRIAESRTDDGVTVGIRTDITRLKRVEAELDAARRTAEAASQAKSRFLAMMSHEIRTPLNGVIGTLGLLAETPCSSEQRRLVDTSRRSAEALLTLLNDILDFSKIEAGKLALEPSPFAPADLVRDLLPLFGPQAAKKGLALVIRIAPDLPPALFGDADRLRQMLMNYLSNAIKFTRSGEVSIEVTPFGPGHVEFAVRDTGPGIPVALQAGLFMEFNRLDKPGGRRLEGTGLGLMITRRLAELMGGTVGVDSIPGVGSRFWFRVPLREVDPAAVVEAETDADASTVTVRRADGARPRVLLAEDNPANQMVARLLLEKIGCHVDAVGTGIEAVQAVRDRPYDVVLMDISMPEMTGLEATRVIRALPGPGSLIPILAVTANAFAEDLAAYRAAGMTGHVTKPIVRTALFSALEAAGFRIEGIEPSASRNVAAGPTVARDPGGFVIGEVPVFQREILDDLLGDVLPEDRSRLVDLFLGECARQLALARTARAAGDLKGLKEVAHSMKSSCLTFGAMRLGTAMGMIEQASSAGDEAAVSRVFGPATALGPVTAEAIRRHVNGG